MPKFSIIIPVCGNEELTFDCLDSIEKNSSDYEVIIIDNGSTPAWQGLSKFIRNEKNLGFPIAVNQGIKIATGEIIIILNNDTLVSPHWLERFEYHLKTFDMVGPVSNCISGSQQLPAGAYAFVDSKLGQIYPWHRLVFFCVAIKKVVFDKIGLLDEQFSPGNMEDDDFCMRAIEVGFKLGIAEDIFIYHLGTATFKTQGIDYQNLLRTNLVKFQAKWPERKYDQLVKKCYNNVYGK